MKRFLNKEEEEYLLKGINDAVEEGHQRGYEKQKHFISDIEDVISQCTEKEFPSTSIRDKNKDELLSITEGKDGGVIFTVTAGECLVNPPVKIENHQSTLSVELEILKEFIESCSRIVEFMEEQDEEVN